MQLGTAHNWVVTTDIATFFDNVRYAHLRNIVSTLNGQHEVVLDILVGLLDELCWRPDYVPSSHIGLPQVQFDAPRLLAHIYLFEIDSFLKRNSSDNFVRLTWPFPSADLSKKRFHCSIASQLKKEFSLDLNLGSTLFLKSMSPSK